MFPPMLIVPLLAAPSAVAVVALLLLTARSAERLADRSELRAARRRTFREEDR